MEDAGADEEQVALRQPQLAAQLCGGVYPEARNTRVAGFSAEAVAGGAPRRDGGDPAASAQPVTDGKATCTG